MDLAPKPAHLAPTALIDSDHPAVVEFSRRATGATARERATSLYYLVRDGFRYDPYRIDLSVPGLRASRVLEVGYGWCVPKAALLAAVARAAGIPARVGYADVRNHLSTERMRQVAQTDLYIWHGYTELWLDGAWVKATPAFNLSLCERFGILPLEWDGRADSLYHPYDREGRLHMEYVNQRGSFDDVPVARIVEDFTAMYPRWVESAATDADFEQDAARERPAA
ncbi:MAG TPA: transglutaminase family protein [Ramlibacter sp.]|nr:transglutaminase family protein [Ramlibacter sp.]